METLNELIAAWNAQDDASNKWAALGEDEIVEFAQSRAEDAERERCARLCETVDGFRDQREHGGKLAALIRKA